jgi:hypothetical protein
MKNSPISVFGWLFILALLVLSCSSNESQTASLQVRLTDAPGDFEAVYIDVQDVQVNSDSSNSESGWKSLTVKKGVYNLMKLTNGLDTLLGDIQLPAGKISQVRLILGSNNTVQINGVSLSMKTPSAQQSGLKIQVHTTLKAGITYKIVLDFDAARSIVTTGNSSYILKPVIRSVVEAESGAIKGVITPLTANPAIFAIAGKDTVASTFANTVTGNFLLNGIPAGIYTVSFSPKAGFSPTTKTGVNVVTGSVTDLGTIQF